MLDGVVRERTQTPLREILPNVNWFWCLAVCVFICGFGICVCIWILHFATIFGFGICVRICISNLCFSFAFRICIWISNYVFCFSVHFWLSFHIQPEFVFFVCKLSSLHSPFSYNFPVETHVVLHDSGDRLSIRSWPSFLFHCDVKNILI